MSVACCILDVGRSQISQTLVWPAMNRAEGAKRQRLWFMAPLSLPIWNQVIDWLRLVNRMKDLFAAA